MLPSKLYEALPYVYVAAGIGIMLSSPQLFATAAGGLLALAGAVVWVLRSENRRSDIKNARHKYGGVLPYWCYELLPFSYSMLALLLFIHSDNLYLYPFAMVLLVLGVQLWMLRRSYRKHQRPVITLNRPLRNRH